MESSLTRKAWRLPATPTLVCFLLNTLDRGLSIVEAEDPDARDGVRMLLGTSSLGKRDVCTWVVVFGTDMLGSLDYGATVEVPSRCAETFLVGAVWNAGALLVCTCSSREGLLFCNLE